MWLAALAIALPLVAFGVAAIWGPRRAVWVMLAIFAILSLAPYLVFGIWAAIEGRPVGAAVGAIRDILASGWQIVGYVLLWTVVFGGAGALVNWGIRRWKAQ
ncbi:MAG: hypothetical protein AAF218_02965 [Pseudomonadota bacterium]